MSGYKTMLKFKHLAATVCIVIFAVFCAPLLTQAENAGQAKPRQENNGYIDALLTQILKRTEAPDAAQFTFAERPKFSRDRRLLELISGKTMEFEAIATKPEWEENLITIRIPLRKGLQGYRLFFIKKEDQPALSQVETLQDLQSYPTGSGAQWSTTPLLEAAGFIVVKGDSPSGLMKMLDTGRFTTFGRGIDEIYYEYEKTRNQHPGLAIEQTFALYIPQPTYIFVTPKRPDLAARLEKGLKAMVADGSFNRLFWQYFEDDITQSNLAGRKVFRIENPSLSSDTPFDQENLWFQPGDKPDRSSLVPEFSNEHPQVKLSVKNMKRPG